MMETTPTVILLALIPYFPIINAISMSFDFDPLLISAQIKAESAFNPRAISPVGAVGLMQVMPRTAKWLGFIKSEKEWAKLTNPYLNVRVGVHYDAWLRRYWSKRGKKDTTNTVLMLASYNAGQGRVRKALKNESWFNRLPKETQIYVHRILGYWADYYIEVIERCSKDF